MRGLVLVIICCICGAGEPADLGGTAPDFAGATWLRGVAPAGAITAVVFWSELDGLDQPALAQAEALAVEQPQVRVVLCGTGDEERVRLLAERPGAAAQTLGTTEQITAWLGTEDGSLPAAVLVGADRVLLWRGRISGLQAALTRELAGGFDRARLAQAVTLRRSLRQALTKGEAELVSAMQLTADLLAILPVDEEAIRTRLDLCRHLKLRDDFRATLASLPLPQLPPGLANALAWELATDEDLAFRHLDLALRLVTHACAEEPEDATIEDTHARVLYLLGEIDEAVVVQLRAVSLDPEDQTLRDAFEYYREAQAVRDARRRAAKAASAPPAVTPPAAP